MATASLSHVIQRRLTGITLQLTPDEAVFLRSLLGSITYESGESRLAVEIYSALKQANVPAMSTMPVCGPIRPRPYASTDVGLAANRWIQAQETTGMDCAEEF